MRKQLGPLALVMFCVLPSGFRLQAEATAVVVGRVVDAASGAPVPGATVSIMGGPIGYGKAPRLVTDARGRFLYRNLPAGSYTLQVRKAGYLEGMPGRIRPEGPSRTLDVAEGERITDLTILVWKYAALTGTIVDERGEPLIDVPVRALRKSFSGGQVQWRREGVVFNSDDRGVYRVANLSPGEYVVVVGRQILSLPTSVYAAQLSAARGDPIQREMQAAGRTLGYLTYYTSGPQSTTAAGQVVTLSPGLVVAGGDDLPRATYPITYHPGVQAFSQATVVRVASGEERTGVDIPLQAVPAARVSGRLLSPDGPVGYVPVRLDPHGTPSSVVINGTPITISDANGGFTFVNVPAGSYTLRAVKMPPDRPMVDTSTRTTVQAGGNTVSAVLVSETGAATIPSEPTWWAAMPLDVGDRDVTDVHVTLAQGVRFSGRLEFDGVAARPSPDRFRHLLISIQPADDIAMNPPFRATEIDNEGNFRSYAFPAGRYSLRISGSFEGWTLASITHAGRDLADLPVQAAKDISGIVITFTDRPATISGTVRGETAPDAEASVILFPSDPAMWVTPNTARLRLIRVTKTGAYTIKALPGGRYYVVAVPDALTAEWASPAVLEDLAREATEVVVDAGTHRVQDLKVVRPRREP